MFKQKKDQEVWKSEQIRQERKARLEHQKTSSGRKKPIRNRVKPANIAIIVIFVAIIAGLLLNSLISKGYRQRNTPALVVDGQEIMANELNFYCSLAAQVFGDRFPNGIFTPEAKRVLASPGFTGANSTMRDDLVNYAKEQLLNDLISLKEADKVGFNASDEGAEAAETVFQQLTNAAAQGGRSFRAILEMHYGLGNDRESVTTLIKNFYRAKEYRDYLETSFSLSPEEIEAEYESDPDAYDQVKFRALQFLPTESEYFDFSQGSFADSAESRLEEAKAADKQEAEETDTPAEDKHSEEELLENAKQRAGEMLTKVKSEADFIQEQEIYAQQQVLLTAQDNPDFSLRQGMKANLSPEMGAFLFAADRKSGDLEIVETNGSVWLLYFIDRGRNTERTFDARHIYFALAEGASPEEDQAVKAKAQAVLDQYLAGAKTEDSFAELAKQNSEDVGSQASGGLYKDVAPGSFVKEFEDFVLAPERKPGDVELVKSSLGYHVIYFVKLNDEIWASQISHQHQQKELINWLDTLIEKTKVEETKGMKYVAPLQ